MTVDLSKLITNSPNNSFKNVNVYTGSLTLPASVPPDSSTPTQTSTTVTLTTTPTFLSFFAFYNDIYSAIISVNAPAWYNVDASGQANIAYPATHNAAGNVGCLLYPIIDGTTVTVIARVVNQTASTFTASITVPFAFVDYALAG